MKLALIALLILLALSLTAQTVHNFHSKWCVEDGRVTLVPCK